MPVSEQLRKAIEAVERRGTTRYRIARDSRIDYAVLVRFLDQGSDIKLRCTADKLADYLGLELRRKPKPKRRK